MSDVNGAKAPVITLENLYFYIGSVVAELLWQAHIALMEQLRANADEQAETDT